MRCRLNIDPIAWYYNTKVASNSFHNWFSIVCTGAILKESTCLIRHIKNSKWVWSGNTTITNCRLPRGTARKSHSNWKVSKCAKIRNRYNQVPHLTQDTKGKMTKSQLDTTNESTEVRPFPAGDHRAHINRRAQRHSKHKTEQKHKRSTKEVPPWNGQ